jgi:hypothetical protein
MTSFKFLAKNLHFRRNIMTNVQSNAPSNTATPATAPKILAKDIHAKWDKISDVEASGMKQTSDLVSQVQAKYSLSSEQAQKDVNVWANGRSF